MGNTKIEWSNKTWNPLKARLREPSQLLNKATGEVRIIPAGKVGYHCEHISPGCVHCYAESMNGRCLPAWGTGLEYNVPNQDKVEIFLDEEVLLQPFKWKPGTMAFVCSMTDLFADFVPDEMIDRVNAVMALCPWVTFQVLTKRAARLFCYYSDMGRVGEQVAGRMWDIVTTVKVDLTTPKFPLLNVWLGVSAENQKYADERVEFLLRTPAARRFISYEPAIEAVKFRFPHFALNLGLPNPDWVIIGGESGPGARPFDLQWARDVIELCKLGKIAVFFKQAGARPYVNVKDLAAHQRAWPYSKQFPEGDRIYTKLKDRKGGNLHELPCDLFVREFPEIACKA